MIYTLAQRIAFSFLLFFISISTFAQTPPSDLNGEDLKTWLIANYYDGNHQTLGYTTARVYLYNYIDNENGIITCVYSGYEVSSAYGGTTTYPAPINCEHTIPQSFFDEANPMVSDLHHLYPTYENWNSTRSNNPFAEIDDNTTAKWMYLNESQTSVPTSNIEFYSEYANSSFEPREDHKGNVARSIFYFYTMYPTEAVDISNIGDIDVFYQWHLDDPVDAAEIERNGQIETYQGDRNPYIDYPDLVARAWSLTPSDPTVPSTPAIQITENTSNLTLNWNNVSDEEGYSLYKSTDGSSYSLLSDIAANTIIYQDNDVIEGNTYYYYVIAYNALGNSSNSSTVNGQLQTIVGGDGLLTDLIISEYIEGSSYNKALEIANFTDAAIDLSNYSIKKQANGSGDWGSQLSLSGTLENGEVYVMVNSLSINTTLTGKADLITNSASIGFNGNDPVALFKGSVLIDIVGTFNSTADFAKDVTLVRNPSVVTPNTTYTIAEWTTYSIDEFSYLGSHSVDSEITTDTEAPTTPSNVTSSNIVETSLDLNWTGSTDNIAVTGYDVYKNSIFHASTTSLSYNVIGLTENTAYSFYIIAKDAAGNISSASNTVNTTTLEAPDTQAPTAPSNLASSNIAETSLDLNWTGSTDNIAVTGYNIYKNGGFLVATTLATYNARGLTENTAYNFYIVAKDAAGNISSASNTINVSTLQTPDSQAPSVPSNLIATNITETSFTLEWDASTDNISVTTYTVYLDGSLYATSTTENTNIIGLASDTQYSITILASDAANNNSAQSTALNVSTEKPANLPELASDLLISEYLEGSLNNKAIEIANFTGNAIDLGSYSIMKQANGADAWGSELQLSGSLAHENVFTIANASAISDILALADLTSTSQALAYNGNDAIGLFKAGELIDIVGVFDNSSVFAENTTLVRKASVNSPTTIYNVDEWDNYSSDEISYLGTHAFDGAAITISDELIYTNFESGWDVWIDGGRDCALYTSGSYAPQGNSAANIQDNSGTSSAFDLTYTIDINTPEYCKLDMAFTFYAISMENGEDFYVEYFDGTIWNIIANYTRGTDFENNNLYSASLSILESEYTFPANMNLRFRCDASGNADDIFVDEIRVTATVDASQNKSENTSLVSLGKTIQPLEQDIELALLIYPMPTHGETSIDINFVEILGEIEFSLYDLQGRVINSFTENTSSNKFATKIDASILKSGIYILNIHNKEFIVSRKIIVE